MGYGDDVNEWVRSVQITDDLAWMLPGIYDAVKCPNSFDQGAPRLTERRAYCAPHSASIVSMVQHLNDVCYWTREEVADWLETLDTDLTFPTEPPPRPEPPPPPGPWKPPTYDDQEDSKVSVGSIVCEDPSTCPICSGEWKTAALGPGPTAMILANGSLYINGVLIGSAVSDNFAKYFKSGKAKTYSLGATGWTITDPDAWLGKKAKEEEQKLAKLEVEKGTPELLKRPDGTVPPALDTESFLKTTESFPTVTLFPGALKNVETEYPTSKDNFTRKGKHRGKHRRT